MILVSAILLCFASGFLLSRLGWSIEAPPILSVILHGALAAGFGLGIFSVVYFVSRVAGFQQLLLADLGVFVALLVAYFFARPRARLSFAPTHMFMSIPPWVERTVNLACAVALAAALYSATTRTLAFPHGDGWDAFSIWNLRARFLFLSGAEHWRATFSSLIPWSHPDYPLLLPGAIAHFWMLLGHDDPRVPAVIAFVFTFATTGLLFSTLQILRGRTSAMLGSLTLLATPAFIEQGTSQYADVPLSFFFLATVALLCLNEESSGNCGSLTILAGVAAAFSACSKNEGLLFLAAILAAGILASLFRRRNTYNDFGTQWRSSAVLLAGALPILLVLFYFKHGISGPGDLFTDGSSALQKLATPTRYWAVLQWFVKDFFRFGRWLLIPGTVLVAGFYLAVKSASPDRSAAMRSCAIALLLTLAGYAAIYVITPRDLYWHLRFSSGRLFLQLWPSAIFLFFLRR